MKGYQHQLEDNQRTLEDKVAQRTRELGAATARAYKLAQHDMLTGLPNRTLLHTRLTQIVADARSNARRVAVLFLDFDFFKRLNDAHGHDVGDQFLTAMARRLTQTVRDNDLVARLGGDEFVIVLADLESARAVQLVLDVVKRLEDAFRQPIVLQNHQDTVTCSIGIAMFPDDAINPGSLLKQADAAM